METSSFFNTVDEVSLDIAGKSLFAFMKVPQNAKGLVVIAHGSGSSRYSPRDQFVAKILYEGGLGVFFMDLLTAEEEVIDNETMELRFDISFLGDRLCAVTDWIKKDDTLKELNLGYFGASTGAAAALVAAAAMPNEINAVVSRGGRPDLAVNALPQVLAPTLLIVGGEDYDVIRLNQKAFEQLTCQKKLEIIPGATHLFSEPGTLEQAAHLATAWFQDHLS